jgi:hypothetical protein
VNEEALAHWGAVVPKTNKQTNELSIYWLIFIDKSNISMKMNE